MQIRDSYAYTRPLSIYETLMHIRDPCVNAINASHHFELCPPQVLLKITGGIDADVPSADGKDGFSCALHACKIHDLPYEVLR